MPIGLMPELLDTLPHKRRLLALDISKTAIGLALSNEGQTIATPHIIINRKKFSKDIKALEKVISAYNIGGFVLGYPLNMDGSEGPRCDAIRSFADEMTNHPEIFEKNPWILLWDERLSTFSANQFLIDTVDMSRAKRKNVEDKLAAQIILQGALDYIQANKAN